MPVFTPSFDPIVDRDGGVAILASKFHQLINVDLIASFAECLDNSTNSALVAPVGFNDQRLISVGYGTGLTDVANVDNVRSRESAYAIAVYDSDTNAYSIFFYPAAYTQKAGMNINVRFEDVNVADAPTFTINSNDTYPIYINGDTAKVGDIYPGMVASLTLSEEQWVIASNGLNQAGMIMGTIIQSVIPLTDPRVLALDGSTIDTTGQYLRFKEKVAAAGVTYPSLLKTAGDYTAELAAKGQCGSFVIDDIAGTMRLPTLTKFISGVSTLADLATTNLAAAPNITGSLIHLSEQWSNYGSATGAFTKVNDTNTQTPTFSGSGGADTANFSAALSNPIYGRDTDLYPTNTKYPFYVVAYEHVPAAYWMYSHDLLTEESRSKASQHPASAIDFDNGDTSVTDLQTKLTTMESTINKDVANGYCGLDSGAKIPLVNIPDSVLGQLEYQGTWNAASGSFPTATQKGQYWIASSDGIGTTIAYKTGDWAVYNGSTFDKVDNTDAVASVNGKIGVVVLNKTDIGLGNVDNTADSAKPVSTAQQTALNLKENTANKSQSITTDTGSTTKFPSVKAVQDYVAIAGGAVTSVNGKTGVVVLTAADVGAYATTYKLINTDISATAAIDQSKINGLTTSLSGKVDKVTSATTNAQLYGKTAAGVQTMYDITQDATANSIVQRGTSGVTVVGTPTDNTHATTKLYVDNFDCGTME